MKLFSLFLVFAFSLSLVGILPSFAEGGGGIDCPEISGVFNFITGSATYKTNSFEGGAIGVLHCEYETESEEFNEPFGEVVAVFHVKGTLSQSLIDEYGCGSVLGEQYSSTYVSSETHFASVAFSMAPLVQAAGTMMAQIEEQNIATLCSLPENQKSTSDVVKKVIEQHQVIEEKNKEFPKSEIANIIPPTPKTTQSELVLPNWIKNNAQWWSAGQINDIDFATGLEYMINQGYIKIPPTEISETTEDEIPKWVKNNAGWWAQDQISDKDFVSGLQFLISNGIIVISNN